MQITASLIHMKNSINFSTMKMIKKHHHSQKLKIGYWKRERGVTHCGCGIGLSSLSAHSCAPLQAQLYVCGPSMRLQIQQRSENIIGADLWLKGCLKVSQSSIKEKGNQAASFS